MFKNKRFLVLGLGKTGQYTVKALKGIASSIRAADSDTGLRAEIGDYAELVLDEKINEEKSLIKDIDFIVVSPGINSSIPLLKEADKSMIPVLSEIELGFLLLSEEDRRNTVAVTGTNGKTTVVTLIDRFLKGSGLRSIACGNIGLPLIGTLGFENTIRVIEVSSFQLERINQFRSYISVLLNITSDHIDRHISFENYVSLKFRIFEHQRYGDYCILNADDDSIKGAIAAGLIKAPKIIRFSTDPLKKTEINKVKGQIYYCFDNKEGLIDISGISLRGEHNISNIMAATAPAVIFGVDPVSIGKELKRIEKLDHRIEFLGVFKGIKCFNDSKSTNPDATIKALSGFGKEVTLIAGGRDKGMDFAMMSDSLEKHVRNLILLGENRQKILEDLGSREKISYEIYICDSMEDAVDTAFRVSSEGQVLLLSPASASMDMFRDYRHRGDVFKKIVLGKR